MDKISTSKKPNKLIFINNSEKNMSLWTNKKPNTLIYYYKSKKTCFYKKKLYNSYLSYLYVAN